MLRNLHVKNLALIDELDVDFSNGLNILSGETGAGKSLIIGSINMALGEKVSKDMLREDAEYALVELVFEVTDELLVEQLRQMDIYPEEGQVICTRRITDARSVAKINSETVPVAKLREVAALLIDIHGQHEHQSLTKPKMQLQLLDGYAEKALGDYKEVVKVSYQEYTALKRELEEKDIDKEQQQRELSLLDYEIQEIQNAHLMLGEDENLETEYRKMQNAKKIAEGCSVAYRMTADGAENAATQIGRALREIAAVRTYDDGLQNIEDTLAQAEAILSDCNHELSDYISSLEFAEEDYYETENRLNEINRMKAKYGDSIEKILEACTEKEARREKLLDYDAYLRELKQQYTNKENELEQACAQLSAIRQEYASKLTEAVRGHLEELNFETVNIEMRFDKMNAYTANGYDEAELYISTNPGEDMKPLAKVASGGELSRIMLAIKTVLAENDAIDTLIFDEIDTGISGRTAQMVSEKMQLIGRRHQVICITHLPQIAAMADTHFLIEKHVENGRTISNVARLTDEDSITELARMLGGVSITDTVLQNAREMKALACSIKK